MRIFITGGARYIGSHMLIELLQNQHQVHVLDNYANSCVTSLDRVARLEIKILVLPKLISVILRR